MNQTTHSPLYQLWATHKETGELKPMPMFPKMGKEAVEQFASTVRMQISLGRVKDWADPQTVICLDSSKHFLEN